MNKYIIRIGVMNIMAFVLLATDIYADQPYIGEYTGHYMADRVITLPAKASVISEGFGSYRVLIQALSERADEKDLVIDLYGVEEDDKLIMLGRSHGRQWKGTIEAGKLKTTAGYYGMSFELDKSTLKSPKEGLKPPMGAIVLFDGTNFDQWETRGRDKTVKWKILEDGAMEVTPGTGSIQTKQAFTDVQVHLEFRLPPEPTYFGQKRANSGVFFNGYTYEVQILDSFGLIASAGDCGSLYDLVRPVVNACFPPLVWQTYDITFHAPVIKNDRVEKLPRITVVQNGVTIHDNVDISAPTVRHTNPHAASGPIVLQDHSNKIQFRNIWVKVLKE